MQLRHRIEAILLACSFLAPAGLAQVSPNVASWSRTYGGSASEQGLHDLRRLSGGRLGVAGYTASFGGPSQSNWLMHVEAADGDVSFQRVSSSATGGFSDGAAMAADGGALFLGRDVFDIFIKHDAWIVRVDSGGNELWSLGYTRPGPGRHFLFDAAELQDGGWIVVGSTSVLDQPPQPAWLVRLDAQGVPLWSYEYGGGGAEDARSVTLTSDGGFAVAGATSSSGAGFDDAWVMKVDAAGAIQWQKTFGGFDTDQAGQIVELGDGGFAVVGSTNSFTPSGHAPWILRLDSAGTLLWHKVVADGVWGDLDAVSENGAGRLVVLGRVGQPGFPSNDLWCAELAAADGRVAWQRAYEGDTGDFGSVVLPLPGAGLVLGGTWGWGFPEESIWLQRTDRRGSLRGCDLERKTAFRLISPPLLVQDGTTVRMPGGAQAQPVGVQLAPSAAQVIERCR